MAIVTKYFWGKKAQLSLTGKPIPFWGLAPLFNSQAQVPGPIIESTVGDTIQVRLYNSFMNPAPIGEPISLTFPGQENVLVRQWPAGNSRLAQPQFADNKLISLTDFVESGDFYQFNALEYKFEATKPGIYLYESGTHAEKQIQMGMYGAILIRPIGYNTPDHSNFKTVYGADTRSRYDVEKILLLGDFDSVMHDTIVPNVYYDVLKFNPDFWVINGRCYPDTLNNDNNSSQPYGSQINCKAGDRVLLRIINPGFQNHTFYLGGFVGRVVAEDSFPLVRSGVDTTYEKTGISLGAGQSVDVIFTPSTPGEFYLYDREYNHLVNEDQFPGGMMTKLIVSPA
jgi:FtsP/CotA-like multicopper oxidase with cupredoxin domain